MSFSRLAGKVALVTGGGSGIGRAICQAFAREGASVGVLDIKTQKCQETMETLPRNHGNKHCAIEADVSKIDDVKRAMEEARGNFDERPNILVNNAAIISKGSHFMKSTEKNFDEIVAVNLKGVYLMAREFVNSLQDSKEMIRGSLVNVSSLAGKVGFGYHADYSAAKAGVIGLHKTISVEYPRHRVRCNVVLPGFVDTPMAAEMNQKVLAAILQTVPMKRLGRPEEIANACLFLASDESSYVHGACLEVGGGLGW